MIRVQSILAHRQEALRSALDTDRDVAGATKTAQRFLSEIKQEYLAAQEDSALRRIAAMLFDIAHQGISVLLSATDVKIHLLLSAPETSFALPQRASPLDLARKWLPFALCLLSAVVLVVHGNLVMMLVGLAALAGSLFQTLSRQRKDAAGNDKIPNVQGETQIDVDRLIGLLDALCLRIDQVLQRQAEQRPSQSELTWTQTQLAALQALWEATAEQDGDYALKLLPSLYNALEAQGVTLVPFAEDHAGLFEMIPGAEPGRTVQPALMQGNHLLRRGQAILTRQNLAEGGRR